MPNLKEVRNRIVSVGSTMQITSAMKMVSAAKLKRAQDAITQMRPYANKLQEILQNVSSSLDTSENAYARTATEKHLSLPELISKFTTHPRLCAGLKPGLIEKDYAADLTIFNPDLKWKVGEEHIKSKSKNNPFLGSELIGKPFAVINKGQLIKCN